MKKTLYILLIFVYLPVLIKAQECDSDIFFPAQVRSERLTGTFLPYHSSGNNSPFLSDWSGGTVILINDARVDKVLLRYDCTKDEILWLRDSDLKTILLDKEKIKGFILQDQEEKPIEFKKVKLPPSIHNENESFVQVLVEGKLSLYLHHKWEMSSLDEIYVRNRYFLCKDGVYIHCKPSKRNIKRIFKDAKPTIKEIITESGLKIRNEDDLIRFVEKYNQ